MSELIKKNNSLNEKFVAKVGETVWYLNIKHTNEENDIGCVFFDEICQGIVVSVMGATDCATCIRVKNINGQSFGAVQEIFFTDFGHCLQAFIAVQGKFFGKDNKDWYAEYFETVNSFISYKYELSVPYSIGEKMNASYHEKDYVGDVHRIVFEFSEGANYPWRNKIEIQVIIQATNLFEEKNIIVSVQKSDCTIVELN